MIGATCWLAFGAETVGAQVPEQDEDVPGEDPSDPGEDLPLPLPGIDELDLTGRLSPQDLYLEVFRGERSTGWIVHLRLDGGELFTTPEELSATGLILPDDLPKDGDGWISLEDVPGLTYRYEPATQRLILDAPPSLRPTQRLGYQPPPPVEVRRDSGWLLSYDVYGRSVADDATLAMTSSLRGFGRFGAVELTGVGRLDDGRRSFRRLDTSWTYSSPERLWTWTAGDFINGGLTWTRPVRMAGLQWRRNFGVRPDLVTVPITRLSGDATVPASMELYLNNVRQFSTEVQDGPFVFEVMPRISGAGQASLIVTDALGQVTETVVPLYVDHQRLAPGLMDFSLEAGFLRLGFAGEEDQYGRNPVVSVSLRRGITQTVTLEGHAEAGPSLQLFGLATIWSPANRWGLVSASYTHSTGDTRGDQYTLGYQWTSRGYGFDVQTLQRSKGFRELGDLREGSTGVVLPTARERDRATFWLPLGNGNLSFTWLRWQHENGDSRRTQSVSLTQNVARRVAVSLSAFHDQSGGSGGGLTVSIPLGEHVHASSGLRHSDGRTSFSVAARRNAPYEGGWGWSVQGGDRPGTYAQATAELRGRRGRAQFGVERIGDRTGGFVRGGGSIVIMDRQLFLSRPIHDAFAVVSTNGRPDMPVMTENRLFGRTGPGGYLLIPDLRSWQRNRITIDPEELAPNYRLGELERTATPADRGGVLLHFDVTEVHPAILTLLGPDGNPLPAGSRVLVVEGGREIITGFDGEAYLEDRPTEESVLEIEIDGALCRYRLPAAAGPLTPTPARYGPLACEEGTP